MRDPITQLDDFGCGVACVAFAGMVPYAEAILLLGRTQASTKGFMCRELCNALAGMGRTYEFKYLKLTLKPKIYQEGVIVFIKRSPRYPYGHYLIRHNDLWMDSWINLPQDNRIQDAQSGFRNRLPGKPVYALFPVVN